MPEIRPATYDDLVAFYGKDRIGPSFKAFAGIVDGEIVGVGGLAFKQGFVMVFLDIKDAAKPYKHHLHRLALRIMRDALPRYRVLWAEADENEPSAKRWLERLGFRKWGETGNLWLALAQS